MMEFLKCCEMLANILSCLVWVTEFFKKIFVINLIKVFSVVAGSSNLSQFSSCKFWHVPICNCTFTLEPCKDKKHLRLQPLNVRSKTHSSGVEAMLRCSVASVGNPDLKTIQKGGRHYSSEHCIHKVQLFTGNFTNRIIYNFLWTKLVMLLFPFFPASDIVYIFSYSVVCYYMVQQ